jgi:hypothetical protein
MSYSAVKNEIFYAVEINIGTTETLEEIGLFEGVIRLISEGKDLTGCSYEDGSMISNVDKYYNFLIKDGINRAGSRINIEDGGDYAYLSGFDITIANKNKLNTQAYNDALNRLQDDNSWIVGSTIKFYVVINNVLYQRWTGVVSNTVFDDKTFRFSCQDRLITDFKEMPETDDGQFIFGSVPFTPLLKKEDVNNGIFSVPFIGITPITPPDEFMINNYASKFSLVPNNASADNWYIGFKQNGFRARDQRFYSPLNSDMMIIRILKQNGIDYSAWLNKTLTAGSDKSVILGVEQKGDEIHLTCKAMKGLNGKNFGKTRQFAGDNWDANDLVGQEFNNSLNWNIDKVKIVISEEFSVYSLGENFDVSQVERDKDGKIIFYTLNEGKYEVINVGAILDENLNIIISPNVTSAEYIGADEIFTEWQRNGEDGFEANTDELFNPIKNTYPSFGGKWFGDKLKKEYDLLDSDKMGRTSHIVRIGAERSRFVLRFSNFDTNNISSIKPAIMARHAPVQFYNLMQDDFRSNFNVPGVDFTWDEDITLPRGKVRAIKPNSYDVGGTGSTGVSSVRPHIPEALTGNILDINVFTMTTDAEYGLLTTNQTHAPYGTVSFRLPMSVYHGDVVYNEQNTVAWSNPTNRQRIRHTHAPAWSVASTNIPEEAMPDNDTVGAEVEVSYPVSIKNYTGNFNNPVISWSTTERTGKIKTRIGRTSKFIQQYVNFNNRDTGDHLTMLQGYAPYTEQPSLDTPELSRQPSFDTPELSSDDIVASMKDGVLELCFSIGVIQSNEFRVWANTVTTLVSDSVTAWSTLHLIGMKEAFIQFFKLGLVVEKNINFDQLFVKKKVDINGDKTNTVAGTIDYIVKDYSGIDYNAGNLSETRGNTEVIWNVGHVIQQRRNTFSVLTELLKQSFVAGYTNRFGKPTFTAWRDTDEFDTIIHDNSIIIRNSIKNFALTPLTNVYNNLKVDFAYDYGLNEYKKSYSVNFVDKYSSFPQYDDELQSLADINSTPNFWNGIIRKYDDTHYAITMPGRPEVLDYLKVGGTLVFPEMFGRGVSNDKQLILKNCYITETISDPATIVQDIIFSCDVIVDETASGASLNAYYTEIKYSDSIILD